MAKMKQKRVLIDPKFFNDICRRCDRWMSVIESHHGEVVSDVIFVSSVDTPVQYGYKGLGARAELRYTDATEVDQKICSSFFKNLVVASEVLSDLGLDLRFNKGGKHSVCHCLPFVFFREDNI